MHWSWRSVCLVSEFLLSARLCLEPPTLRQTTSWSQAVVVTHALGVLGNSSGGSGLAAAAAAEAIVIVAAVAVVVATVVVD